MQCVHYEGGRIFYCEVTDMPDAIESPVLEVFSRWGAAVSKITGADNYSMDGSETNASGKRHMHSFICLEIQLREVTLKGMNAQQCHHFK